MSLIEEKAPKITKQVVTVETEEVAPVEVKAVEINEKPRFRKEYYENRLEVLKQELKEVEAEFKLNKKDFGPLEKVYKTFARDDAKLRRQEAIVAKQQVSVHGVNKKSKISDAKKAKVDENIKQLKKLVVELKKLINSLSDKAEEFKDVTKMGRTHLQDALPIKLGQEFVAYANGLTKELKRIELTIDSLCDVNMGATAIGTSLNANEKYRKKVIFHLGKFSGEPLRSAKDLVDSTRNLDSFGYVSNSLKLLALNLSRIAKDLCIMASNSINEIILPHVQSGSSLMPGKFNPVVPEMVSQVCYYVVGLDTTITMALEDGQLEVNVNTPVVLMSLYEQITTLRRAIRTFNNLAIVNLKATDNHAINKENSIFLITALAPHIGHNEAINIVHEVLNSSKTIKEIIIEKELLTEADIESILDDNNLTNSGIVLEELLKK